MWDKTKRDYIYAENCPYLESISSQRHPVYSTLPLSRETQRSASELNSPEVTTSESLTPLSPFLNLLHSLYRIPLRLCLQTHRRDAPFELL